MSEPPKDKDQEKGDEVLRRLLKTPPDPKAGKRNLPRNADDKIPAATTGSDRGDEKA
jgi:hypothetical protein